MPLLTGAVTDFQATTQGSLVGPYIAAHAADTTVTALTNLTGTFISKQHWAQDRVLEQAVSSNIGASIVGMVFKGTLSDVSSDSASPTTIDAPAVGHFQHINSVGLGAGEGFVTWTDAAGNTTVKPGDNIVWDGTAFVTFDSGDVTLTGSEFVQVSSEPVAGGYAYTATLTTGIERVADTDTALTNLLNAYNGVVQRLQSIEAQLAAVQNTTQVTDTNGDAQDLAGSLPAWPTGQNPSSQGPTAGDARGDTTAFTNAYIQG